MYFRNEYRKKAHQKIEFVFRKLLPQNNLHEREEQIGLCHEMLDTLIGDNIALCDAGVGIGKTYAYLLACVLMHKYSMLKTGFAQYIVQPLVISTSSIALQRAIIEEYIPFLSKLLVRAEIIQVPLRGVMRKGKEHFVCDSRLDMRLEAVRDQKKNDIQQRALISLKQHFEFPNDPAPVQPVL